MNTGSVKICFGVGNEILAQITELDSLDGVLHTSNAKRQLGFPTKVRFYKNKERVQLHGHEQMVDGDRIDIETYGVNREGGGGRRCRHCGC